MNTTALMTRTTSNPRFLNPTLYCFVVEHLTSRTAVGYKESVVIIRARAYCCCCPVALWAPELTVVSR